VDMGCPPDIVVGGVGAAIEGGPLHSDGDEDLVQFPGLRPSLVGLVLPVGVLAEVF
jgi:hypothetical protein